ncbi:uncharacterized protein LY89DRAFT_424672 [Mollisia scopiformis]|uniref:Uncharacterized protein n=1 Tax=Mollisia scopiformis TaxID=149040 RepID=A0A194XLE7_MOLSC|nr:uncharacterized protein LY89DRAFT_424672 [Mollisia scopiformis]KUJ21065.1 hypothetical protein LY89DRAFT_424672 [Mollisia scopiformis]
MDQFNQFHAIGDNASMLPYGNSQTQEVPNSAEPLPLEEEVDYDFYLQEEPADETVDRQSLHQDKASTTPDALGYENLMNMDFGPQNEYLGDTDLFALPYEDVADTQAPPAVEPQAMYPEVAYYPDTPPYISPIASLFSPLVALPTIITTQTPSGPEQVGAYRNPILSLFTDPATPLSVIDNLIYPFGHELQVALEKALQLQQNQQSYQAGYLAAANDLNRRAQEDQSMEQELRNYLSPLPPMVGPMFGPNPTPIPEFITDPDLTSVPVQEDEEEDQDEELNGKKYGNRRPFNIRNFDPTKFYTPIASKPESWGSIDPETDEPIFKYTAFGELNPLSAFTPAQIAEYIGGHPLNQAANSDKFSGLTLLIQTVPADSGRRYPNKASDKCRFSCCPDHLRTIRKGDFRVAFDEAQNATSDPYHNAGYVHLSCLERFLDFPQICKDFNVQPDTRVLPEGKNKMAITRDHASMEGVVRTFIEESLPWGEFGDDGMRPEEFYEYTLNYMLTVEHLERQPKHLQRIRERRGGVSIDLHMNNLELYVDMVRARKEEQSAKTKRGGKQKKRQRDESDDEDSGEEILVQRALARERPSKKMRTR